MFHKIMIVGNLGRDPEMRFTPSGKAVTSFSVATNRKWTNSDGTPGEETTWFKVSAWGRMAEVTNQYLSKGRLVMVEGTMTSENGSPRVWTGNDGVARASFEVNASMVKFLGGGRDNGAATEEEGPSTAEEREEDELPF